MVRLLVGLFAFSSCGAFAAEQAAVLTSFDGVQLRARWSVPTGEPKGVLVLLPGSGNVGLDGDVSHPFVGKGYRGAVAHLSEQLAQALTAHGYTTFRYAKRGVEDPKQATNQTMPYLVKDAASALEMARARFANVKSGFVGFSEGAWVATIAAAERKVDALFLLGLPTRPFDDVVSYQFTQWPYEFGRRLDRDQDGTLDAKELAALGEGGILPLLGPGITGASWAEVDANNDRKISLADELIPAYQKQYQTVLAILNSPGMKDWYKSLQDVAPIATFASKITAPVYFYHGLEDAHVNWSWVVSDQRLFGGRTATRVYPGLGHCFAPMDGAAHQFRTSGPFAPELLTSLVADIKSVF